MSKVELVMKFFTLVFGLLSVNFSVANTIISKPQAGVGLYLSSNEVCVGESITFHMTGSILQNVTYRIDVDGRIFDVQGNESVTVPMPTVGSFFVTAGEADGTTPGGEAYAIVTVNALPSKPPVAIIDSEDCGLTVMKLPSAPSGVVYYWQTSSSGYSTSNSNSTKNFTSNSTYYIRGFNASTVCWSVIRSGSVTVNEGPDKPFNSYTLETCLPTTLLLSQPSGTVTYYWQTSINGTSKTDQVFEKQITQAGKYYVRGFDSSINCWGQASYHNVTDLGIPPTPTSSDYSINLLNCGQGANLTAGSPPSGTKYFYKWKLSGTTTLHVNTSGNYELVAEYVENWGGCQGAPLNVYVNVKDVPTTPSIEEVSSCGKTDLSFTIPSGEVSENYKYYWQEDTNGQVIDENKRQNPRTINSNGTYYLQAYNSSDNCWGSVTSINVEIKEVPDIENIFVQVDNYCGYSVIEKPNPIGDWTYYWQSDNNTQIVGDTRPTINVDQNDTQKTYFLAAKHNVSGCWNNELQGVQVTAAPKIIPEKPVATLKSYYGYSEIIASDIPGVTNFWQGTVQDGDLESTSIGIKTIENTDTYYVRAKSDDGCWGDDVEINVSSIEPEVVIISERDLIPQGSSVQLSTEAMYDSYSWKLNGIEVSISSTFDALVAGEYSVSVTKSGVQGEGTANKNLGSFTDQDINYVITIQPQVSGLKTESDVLEMNPDNLIQSASYFDGLGRNIQDVQYKQSPLKNDLVKTYEYDDFGRRVRDYLPYAHNEQTGFFKSISLKSELDGNYLGSPQNLFYTNQNDVAHDQFAYADIKHDDSPLNRVIEQGAPGQAWQIGGASIKYTYSINEANDFVKRFDVSGEEVTYYDDYSAGLLSKVITTDENGYKIVSFENNQGQIILKRVQVDENETTWADTYYVYDDFANLIKVFPPEASKALEGLASSSSIPSDVLTNWCFQYKYDDRNRMIEKKVPGSDWVYMVYDDRDRLVLTQDGNQREKKEWIFTKYDQLNRPISTGKYTDNVHLSQPLMQIHVDDYYNYNLEWQSLNGLTHEGNLVTKTEVESWTNSGGYSNVIAEAGEDTYIKVIATETNTARMFGLSEQSLDDNYTSIDYAIYLAANGYVYLYNSGSRIVSNHLGAYETGDVFEVKRTANTISYLKNGVELLTDTELSTTSLIGDFSLKTQGATLHFQIPEFFEIKGNDVFGYSNNSFPVLKNKDQYLTISYYDNYDFNHANLLEYQFEPQENNPSYNSNVKGQMTGSIIKILETNDWLRNVNYYDNKYRLIQQKGNDHLNGVNNTVNEYDFVGNILSSKSTSIQSTPIIWTKRNEVYEEAGIFTGVTKSTWGAGMSSINKLQAGDDGYFQTVITDLDGYRFVGFNDYDGTTSMNEIDYGIYFYGKSLRAYYQGTNQQTIGFLELGDVIKLERENSIVKLYQNGTLVYTYSQPSTTDLIIDVSFHTNSPSVGYFTTNLTVPTQESPFDLYWTAFNNMTEGENSLTKITSNGWNGNFSSVNKLKTNEDGWFEFEAASQLALMIGMSEHDLSAGYSDIDYALYLMTDGTLRIYEDGVNLGDLSSYQIGDVFRINRLDGIIQYIQNDIVIYESQKPSTSSLIVDGSFYAIDASLINIRCSFGIDYAKPSQINIARDFDYDHAFRLVNTWHSIDANINWQTSDNVDISKSTLELTDNQITGLVTSGILLNSEENGYLIYKAEEVGNKKEIGFSSSNSTNNFLLLHNSGNDIISIQRNGVTSGSFNYSIGDLLKIERKDNKILFYKNDILQGEFNENPELELHARIALIDSESKVTDLKFGSKVLLFSNEFNELGELVDKKLYSKDEGLSYAQSTDYRYNIRGWLTRINDSQLTDGENDYFGMQLGYNSDIGIGLNTSQLQFNGNISAVKWSKDFNTNSDEIGYGYHYDPMNRITKAQSHFVTSNAFNLESINYDLNGNIISLTRNNANGLAMDELTYDYLESGQRSNRLQGVSDASNDVEGFNDGNVGVDYEYDANGNMKKDKNKSIQSISYNHLNLPKIVEKTTGERIRYVYSADGSKLSQFVEVGNVEYQSDFSQDLNGVTLNRVNGYPNQDGIAGEDDVLKITSHANGAYHLLQLILPIEMKRTRISADVFIPSDNTNVDGVYLQLGANRQYFDIALDEWNHLEWEYVANSNVVQIRQASIGEYDFIGAGSSDDDITYVKNLVVTSYESKATDYIGEFIYKTNEDGFKKLALIQHEEGRIVPDEIYGGFEYQYHLKDHLGNTRVTFTTKPKTINFTLNYEGSSVDTDDADMFEELNNIIQADVHDYVDASNESFNHDKVQALNGATNGVIGSVLTIPVGKGDKINAQVYAKYLAPETATNPTAAVGSLLIAALTGNTGTLNYEGSINSSYSTQGSIVTNMYVDDLDDTRPYAFINLLFLPEDVTATPRISYGQIPASSSNAMSLMTLPVEYEAPSAGYIVVYLSNESANLTNVYFDDLKVTVNEHPVIQRDDYYPFGMAFNNGYQRVTAKENRFKYNGKELIEDLDVNWYDYGARMYMADIGRWGAVDPLAEKYLNLSPFTYVANNPLNYIDPDGRKIKGVKQNDDGSLSYSKGAIRNGTQRIVQSMQRTNTGQEQVNMLLGKNETVKMQLTDKLLVLQDGNGKWGKIAGDASQSHDVITVSTAEMDGKKIDMKDAYTVTESGEIVKVNGLTDDDLRSTEANQYNDLPNTGSIDGEINATAVHESEHLTEENKQIASEGGDAEKKPTEKEKRTREEYIKNSN